LKYSLNLHQIALRKTFTSINTLNSYNSTQLLQLFMKLDNYIQQLCSQRQFIVHT